MTEITEIITLFFGALAGGIAVFFFRTKDERKLKLLIAFSGSYLLAICLLHLIPEIYSGGTDRIGVYILAGFFMQVLLEFFSGGIEHGHFHVRQKGINAVPAAIVLGLCIHALTEGMPLGAGMKGHNILLLGIVLHKMPIAFVLMAFMMEAGVRRAKAVGILLVFALMAPLGILIGNTLSGQVAVEKLLAVVIGIFLHVSTTILFESTDNHRFNIQKIIIIIFGAGLAFIHV